MSSDNIQVAIRMIAARHITEPINYGKLVMDFVRQKYPDAREDEVDERDTLSISAAARMADDCIFCTDTAQCPHSAAVLDVYPVMENGIRRFRVLAHVCDKISSRVTQKKITDIYEASRIPRSRHRQDFDKFDTCDNPELSAAKNIAMNCAKKGSGLTIGGPVGCGKTHLAIAIAVEYMERGESVLFYTMPDLMEQLRVEASEGKNEILDNAREAALLILDDAGAERVTDWSDEQLYKLINSRYEDDKPVIITTNAQSMEHLKEIMKKRIQDAEMLSRAERICSRLTEMTRQLWLKDVQDYRKIKKDKEALNAK